MNDFDIKSIRSRLEKGNQKFRSVPFTTLDTNEELRAYLEENGQHPFAIVIACADSRVNPEAIFCCGLGEIFVIRSAGHVVLDGEMASVAYAIDHLHCPYILVLGHTNCGAVKSVLKGMKEDLLSPILEYVATALNGEKEPREAERKNVLYSVDRLQKAFPTVRIEGAVYDIKTGEVTFLD